MNINNDICKECGLYQYSDNPMIHGKGSDNPSIILIGEAPGCEEAKEGEVFIGKAGRKLSSMLQPFYDLGIYITNTVKCFPPLSTLNPTKSFRVPTITEIELCKKHLITELNEITETLSKNLNSENKTPVIVPLGNTALYAVLGCHGGITKHLGQVYGGVELGNYQYSVIPNYHPSYICRNPRMESEFVRVMNICKDYLQQRKE